MFNPINKISTEIQYFYFQDQKEKTNARLSQKSNHHNNAFSKFRNLPTAAVASKDPIITDRLIFIKK